MWIKRTVSIYIFIVLILMALLLRVGYISFGSMTERIESVAGNRSATISLYNGKGVIYDRNYVSLAGNQFVYQLIVNPRGFDRSKIDYILSVTGSDKQEFLEKLNSEKVFVLKSYQMPEETDGVYVFEGFGRYPENPVSKHIIGYLDNNEEVGLSGIEKAYNEELSAYSYSASVNYSVNAVRGAIDGLGLSVQSNNTKTENGIVLTLDKNLCEFAEESLRKHITDGAVIVLNANNGEILSMSSLPDFDVNCVYKYLNSKNGELLNNAVQNQTVGSVFKIVVAASALMNGFENFEFECVGGIKIGDKVFSCQNSKKHGKQDIYDAFSNSCNSYFIAIGQLLGYDKLIETSQLFGVDCNIKICKELFSSAGKLPDDSGIYSLANFSIGQGELMISPLEIARITSAVCNGGYLVNPTIYYGTYNGETVDNKSSYKYKTQLFSSDIAQKLKKMCVDCVEKGNGKSAKPSSGLAGGKTASAQTGKYNSEGKEILNTYFTGFYPADNPEYVITVFAKNGKSGSATCAPVFKEICDFIDQNY